MTFSDTVARQREQQEKTLKRFITYSLAGSFALHGIGLGLKVNNLWNAQQAEPEEISIIVTESPEEELTEVVPPEEPFSESEGGPEGSSGEPGAATFVERPSAPQPAVSEPPVQDEPIAEEEPEPEPTPVPLVEDVEEPVTDEAVEDEPTESPLAEEVTPETRDLSSLLGDLRRAREQASQAAANRNSTSTGDDSLGGGDRGSTVAVGPTGSGRGSGGEGTGSARGNGSGTGERTGSGEGNETGEGNRSEQGSRSREITCRGCDFDYPESADGAEGTAQVVVETDEQGRVVSVMLSRSSGNAALDRAALEQARRRVRLNNARAGESYPIDVDFVQPNSAAAERVRERGDRRTITVSEPASEAAEIPETPPVTATETPPASPAGGEPPLEPSATPLPSPFELDSPSPTPESSTSSEAEPSPPEAEQPISPQPAQNAPTTPIPTTPISKPPTAVETAPSPAPEPPPAPLTQPEPSQSPEPPLVEP